MRRPLSIVVPFRGSGQALHDLGACLDALLDELGPSDEVILVNDGLPPETTPWPAATHRVTLLHRPPRGPAAARNFGASQANHPFIAFIDADVVISPGTLNALATALADEDVSAVQGTYSPEAPTGANFATRFMALLQDYNFAGVRDPLNFQGLSSFCIAVKRRELRAAGGFDETITRATMEDDNLGHAILWNGGRIRLAREVQVMHLARYTATSLCIRMSRMAADKILSLGARPARVRVDLRQSHHRPEFLLATALAPLGLMLLPMNSGLGSAVLVCVVATHASLIRTAVRRYGVTFALRSGGMLVALATAAAVGCGVGGLRVLTRRSHNKERRPRETESTIRTS